MSMGARLRPSSEGEVCRRGVEAYHCANPSIAGLVWIPRRCDPNQAYLFEDRVSAGSLTATRHAELAASPDRVAELCRLGQRANNTLMR